MDDVHEEFNPTNEVSDLDIADDEDDDVKKDCEMEVGIIDKIKKKVKTKESKAGILYLSTVPPGMNVKQIREYFSQFGEVNRSFLQADKKGWKSKVKQKNQTFTEGWIEFRKRRHAKRAATTLNNNPVGGKKRKIYHDFLWNIKYLSGFQWAHLNERLAYERISLKQRLRTEISAVKRETDFFSKSIDLSKKLKKKGIIGKGSKISESENIQVDMSEEVISKETKTPDITALPMSSKKNLTAANPDRASFFKSLFVKSE